MQISKLAAALPGMLALSLALAMGCDLKQIVRSEYSVDAFGQLLVSNSEALGSKPHHEGHGKIRVDYPLIVRNASLSRSAELLLKGATMTLGSSNESIPCKPFGLAQGMAAPASFVLEPGKLARIDCELRLEANSSNRLAMRDTSVELSVPTQVEGVPGPSIQFRYSLKIEDFE